ncbi:hypothetical protein SAMN05216464_105124 [Mucilaginibacter pineti]|uniref:Tetratricopeptide repeat-containing protein n=2 Tax=Mucilaginibacter pineti TaxID=1391627 RepID=A0A1G7BQV9_9SPHI|nr:hypothetical protein SAMN05216464_105124 [Mucilaginibacter pineti]
MVVVGLLAQAQNADKVYDQYLDFNLARLQNEQDKAMDIGEKILPDTLKLPQKVRISYYNSMAKLYEDGGQSVKAIAFYKMVIAAQPNYYVAHRALGYLLIKGIADKAPNAEIKDEADIAKVKNALPHLEKAQACDPDDNTLILIKSLYQNIKDDKVLDTLPARLEKLKKNCEDILSDQ